MSLVVRRLVLLTPLVIPLSAGAAPLNLEPVERVPRFAAVRVSSAPKVDGVLDDTQWSTAPVITNFTQYNPDEGKPATVDTKVRVVYDDDALYVAAELIDVAPPSVALGRRDTEVESDWFRVYLDPHLDRRSGNAFWVNPSNVQIDMALYDDTRSDRNWDGVWSSATHVGEDRWSVEMRIPYSQLRFPERDVHVWGFNVIRRVFRNNEQDRLVHTPKTESGFVSRFAYMTGIEGIQPRKTLEILPYVSARADRDGTVDAADPVNEASDAGTSIGLDIKYGLTSNLTLTGAVNPDFGQVEQDPAVLNLSEFELFFPEKRPFFVEGAGLFDFGNGASSSRWGFNFFTPSFFYSRRIGRTPQGGSEIDSDYLDVPTETTILGAAKLTGKTSSGWSIGFLDAYTDDEVATASSGGTNFSATVEPPTNYLVSRIARDIGTRGRIGSLFTAVNRSLDDSLGYLRDSAYTGGVDGYQFFGANNHTIVEWFAGGTLVEGSEAAILSTQRSSARYYQRPDASHVSVDPNRTSLSGFAGRLMVNKEAGKWRYNVQAQSYSPGFETNDLGFLQRSDITATHAVLRYINEDTTPRFRERSAWIGKYQNWNYDGDLIANGLRFDSFLLYPNYWYTFHWGGMSFDSFDDRKTRGGPVVERAPSWDLGGGFGSDSRRRVWFETWAGFWDAEDGSDNIDTGMILRFRPRDHFSIQFRPTYETSVTDSQYITTRADAEATSTYSRRYVFGVLDQHTFNLETRLDWSFTSRLTFQLYLQPFVATGDYESFKELAAPRTRDYLVYGADRGAIAFDAEQNTYTVDPDGSGPAQSFTFANPDFNFRSLRASAIVRWEFRPGSALYFVWNENKAEEIEDGSFDLGRDLRATTSTKGTDAVILKMSYLFGA